MGCYVSPTLSVGDLPAQLWGPSVLSLGSRGWCVSGFTHGWTWDPSAVPPGWSGDKLWGPQRGGTLLPLAAPPPRLSRDWAR